MTVAAFDVADMISQGADTKEWALCYFSSQHDKDAKGWIYLNDITEIKDDGKFFTVVSPQRTMQLEAQTPTQQRLWIRGLVGLCPNANTSGLQSESADDKIMSHLHHTEFSDFILSVMCSCC